jgi:SAM-dependent methyltransferase
MLAYQAWRLGHRVLGVSFKPEEVRKCGRQFNQLLGIPEAELRFSEGNLYSVDLAPQSFDQIVCCEVLEHLRQDAAVCVRFAQWLRPGGVLHVTVPNRHHPYNASFPLDANEHGGHVRPGYCPTELRALLNDAGFVVEELTGFGGPVRQWFNRRIKEWQSRYGVWSAAPLFVAALPLLWLDAWRVPPAQPYAWYVRGRLADRAPMAR